MLRRPAVLLLISAGMHLTAHAQETAIRSSDGDSLRYSYTPLPPQAPEKRPFCGASSIISGSRPPTRPSRKR